MASTIVQTGPFIALADIVKTVLYGYTNSQLLMSSFYHVCLSTGGASITCGDLAKQLEDNWVSNLTASQYTAYQFLGARSQIISDVPLLKAGVATDTAVGGAVMGQAPLNIAPIVERKTGFAGRQGRGRVYMPAPDVGQLDTDGTPLATNVTINRNAVQSIQPVPYISITGALGGTCNLGPVLYQRATKTTKPITSINGLKLMGQQHRRGNYGRPNLPLIPL